jgi:hypothetical protein
MNDHDRSQQSGICLEHLESEFLSFLTLSFVDSHHTRLRCWDKLFHGKSTELNVLFIRLYLIYIGKIGYLLAFELCEFVAKSVESQESLIKF